MSRVRSIGLWSTGVALAALATPLAAQGFQIPPGFGSGNGTVYREDPASALGRYLRIITASPRDLEALTGAGRAALEVGDPQAAIGFYARAEAIAPRNGRIKGGLGSALVLLGQAQAALRYFGDATDLGVPEADIASDRGLAYDLRGNAKRAQRDYAVALRRGEDAETTRRMALSLAIGGERDAALTLLDPLLRRQDTAAWRARAFILAMTGDTAGASRAAESVMPAAVAAGFVPFFRKLPMLRAGEKAAAVHFGLFPGEARPIRIDDLFNQAEVAARVALENAPRSATDAGSVDGAQVALGRLASRAPDAEGQLRARLAPSPPSGPRIATVSTPRPNAGPARVTGTLSGATGTAANAPATQRPAPAAQAARPPGGTPAGAVPTSSRPSTSVPIGFRTVATASAPLPGSTVVAKPAPATASPAAPTPSPVRAPVITPATIPAPTAPTTSVASGAAGASPATAEPAPASLPGFSAAGIPAFPPPQPAPLPIAAPQTRLADVAATVQEATGEPLVRAVELPASTIPGLPPQAAPSSTRAPTTSQTPTTTQAAPTTRLADVAKVLAETPRAPATAPAATAPAATAPAATGTAPPASKPKVEVPATALQQKAALAAAPPAPKPKVETPKPKAELAAKSVARPATGPDEAVRIWVQVAGGADEGALPAEWKRLKGKAPDLLATRSAWTTPLKATNRLLVGPFDTDKDAQEFVNKLKPKGITAFAWTSAQGQTIAKLAGR